MTAASFPVIDLHRTGHRIECQRRAAGLSVRELQQYFGFEYPQAIYKWQHGECLPTVDNLLALSRILHVGMEDLLVYEDQEVHFFFARSLYHLLYSYGCNSKRTRRSIFFARNLYHLSCSYGGNSFSNYRFNAITFELRYHTTIDREPCRFRNSTFRVPHHQLRSTELRRGTEREAKGLRNSRIPVHRSQAEIRLQVGEDFPAGFRRIQQRSQKWVNVFWKTRTGSRINPVSFSRSCGTRTQAPTVPKGGAVTNGHLTKYCT